MWLCRLCLSVFLLLAACSDSFVAPDRGKPCLIFTEEIRPLLIGEIARIPVGRTVSSDCVPAEEPNVVWSTSTPNVVDVDAGGLITAKVAGPFEISAQAGDTKLTEQGFAFPRGWRPRIAPAATTVRVGEEISFRVTAVDERGQSLPQVPFSIYTPEFDHPERDLVPIVDKYSHQGIMGPATFRATRVGKTRLRAVIGQEEVFADLEVVA